LSFLFGNMSAWNSDPWDVFPEHDYMAEKHTRWRMLALVCVLFSMAVAGLVAFTLIVIGAS
jgi:hypothetical protein